MSTSRPFCIDNVGAQKLGSSGIKKVGARALQPYTLCLKNDADVAHYNVNAHQQILVILAEMLLREYAIKW